MARDTNSPPIIKRKKVVAAEGHHGGAWKVAYADFVTAMMAFFLLMWLINATSEKQREGIADYFNPTVSATRLSSGGTGAFGGESVFSEMAMVHTGTGALAELEETEQSLAERAEDLEALKKLDAVLKAIGGESMTQERLLRHIVTRLTDEGLVIEIFDLPESPLFEGEGAHPRPILRELTKVVAQVMAQTRNSVAVHGFVMSYPITLIDNPTWRLSSDRAQVVRELLEISGLAPERLTRVAGQADRKPIARDPMDLRNNRIEMILLRNLPDRRR